MEPRTAAGQLHSKSTSQPASQPLKASGKIEQKTHKNDEKEVPTIPKKPLKQPSKTSLKNAPANTPS